MSAADAAETGAEKIVYTRAELLRQLSERRDRTADRGFEAGLDGPAPAGSVQRADLGLDGAAQ